MRVSSQELFSFDPAASSVPQPTRDLCLISSLNEQRPFSLHSAICFHTQNMRKNYVTIAQLSPDRGPFSAHSPTLTMRGMSLRRSRVGVPSNSRLLCMKRCTSSRAALLGTCSKADVEGDDQFKT